MGLKNDGLNNFTVYMHKNIINGKKYIGITSQDPKKRWHGGNGYYRNIHFHRAIEKYGWENFEHIILATELSKEEAITMEKELINKYDTTNRDKGYNVGLGGEGINSLSEESREKIRQAHLGSKRSKETCHKISESRMGEKNWRYGKHLSEQHKQALLSANIGKHLSDKHKDRITETRGYITFQYNLDGEYINSYRSTGEASRVLNISNSGIKACCSGRIASDHGFIFRYKKDGYVEGENLIIERIKEKIS